MNDFPEFQQAYNTVLLPDDADQFNHLAAATRFNIYNSPIWRVQGKVFSHAIIQACIDNLFLHGYDDAADQLAKHFEVNHE